MSNVLEKAKELAKRVNATVVVVNETTNDAFVILSLDEYERLVNQSSTPDFKSTPPNIVKEYNNQPMTDSQMPEEVDNKVAALTEDELLARINQEIAKWRGAQTDKENIVLAEIPPDLNLRNDKGNKMGEFKLNSKVNFEVDNLEEEERFFLSPLD